MKDVAIEIDVEELDKRLSEKAENPLEDEEDLDIDSVVISAAKDPRSTTLQDVAPPELFKVVIERDRLENPVIVVNFRTTRFDVDANGVIGFRIYRKKINEEDIVEEFRSRRTKTFLSSDLAFSKLSRGITRRGKFSAERKARFVLRNSLIPLESLNPQLALEVKKGRSREFTFFSKKGFSRFEPLFDFGQPTITETEFENFLEDKKFKEVGYVDYTNFINKEKQKFVFVRDRNSVDLSFKDKSVAFGEVYQYYVTAVTDSFESKRSDIVRVKTDYFIPLREPKSLTAKQINENEIQLSICVHSDDDIAKVFLFRKSENQSAFLNIAEIDNVGDCINVVDQDVDYGVSYTYRVVLQDIYGNVSEPKTEITGENHGGSVVQTFSSVQKITAQSRSNNLKIPIVSAVQDQNSDFIKITISPNDSIVSFYELERRDLTIHERRFSVPSQINTNYGGVGWGQNKLFVEFEEVEEDDLRSESAPKEIVFFDNTVQPDHIYQYRVKGCDLLCNSSPYAFSLIRASGKKVVRTPINLRYEIIRGHPFRVKVLWDDDNAATAFSASEVFETDSELNPPDKKFIYKVQRRKFGEKIYETFPLTSNNFLIDEVPSLDTVDFSGQKNQADLSGSDNIGEEESNVVVVEDITRAFNVPNYLQEGDPYFYRIAAVAPNEEESNFTAEIEVPTIAEISDPINFKAQIFDAKVFPLVVSLTWENEETRALPDHWIIEKKVDSINDTFEILGRAYLNTEFFDMDVEPGNNYIYRIKSVDLNNRESDFFEARLTV